MNIKNKYAFLGSIYNKEDPNHLRECLDSLLNQTQQIPIVLVVDGELSSDLEAVLNQYQNILTHVIRISKNQGLGKALSKAVKTFQNEYDYFIRFDTDDINLPNRAEFLINIINLNNPDLVSSSMYEFGEFKEKVRSVSAKPITLKSFAFTNPIFHPASAFQTKKVLSIGCFEHMPAFEDWLCWMKLAKSDAKIMLIDEPLIKFRVNKEMINRRFGWDYFKKK